MTVPVRAGHFVLERGEHVIVHSSAKALEPKAAADIVAAFVIGSERSPAQDLEYSIRQLVEVALRALSPSLNDPFTAIAVVDRLGAALQELLQRELPARMLFDKSGDLRVIASRSDFAGLIEVSFAQIRQSAMQHPSVLIHMADTIGKLAPTISGGAGRAALRDQLELLRQTAEASTVTAGDRNAVLKRIDDALASEAFGCIAPRSPGDTARRAVPVT